MVKLTEFYSIFFKLLAIQLIPCDDFCEKLFVIKIMGSLSMPAKEMYQIICNPAKENWMK